MSFKKTHIEKNRRQLIGTSFVVAAMTLVASTQTTFADQVKLTTFDGKVQLTGEIVGTFNDSLILSSIVGSFVIDPRLVACSGLRCPAGTEAPWALEKTPVQNITYTSGPL